MKKKILKKRNNEEGFALLFSVLLSSIILAIALGVSSVALKEIKFGTSAKDSNEAFFAADTGIECALFNDRLDSNVFVATSPENPIVCASGTVTVIISVYPFWSFVLSGLGEQGKACAKITVDKGKVPMEIISNGYNLGGDDVNCISSSTNKVERRLEVTK